MEDTTTADRMFLQACINGAAKERQALVAKFGQVWDTEQLKAEFHVTGFMAPFVGVRRKSDGASGSLLFQHAPRFYWGWQADQ